MKMILSDKIENINNTAAVNVIRFTIYNDNDLSADELKILFEEVLHEKILKICEENDFEWKGYKHQLHEIIEPSDLVNEDVIKCWVTKNMVNYILFNWEDRFVEYDSIDILKEFMNS